MLGVPVEHIPMITVLNKADKLGVSDVMPLEALLKLYPGSIAVSAKDRMGLTQLCEAIESALSGSSASYRFPPERTDLAALVHRSGQVLFENYGDHCIEMKARLDGRTIGRLKEYQVNE